MKGNFMPSLMQMDNETLQHLVAEVKETIATELELAKPARPSIKVVDLWKIERNKKSATRTFAQKRNHIPFI
ncbi:MAG TPA: hypothetical protein VNV85_09365 [Puia sp.]|jgi:hypothetical protein|nr:hypothetical protein [Puia sp.]